MHCTINEKMTFISLYSSLRSLLLSLLRLNALFPPYTQRSYFQIFLNRENKEETSFSLILDSALYARALPGLRPVIFIQRWYGDSFTSLLLSKSRIALSSEQKVLRFKIGLKDIFREKKTHRKTLEGFKRSQVNFKNYIRL